MLPYVVIHSFHAKEHLFPQDLARTRQLRAVKGELAMQIGQPFPLHVHDAEVIPVKLAVMPAGINQNGPVRPDFSVRVKIERPRLAVGPA